MLGARPARREREPTLSPSRNRSRFVGGYVPFECAADPRDPRRVRFTTTLESSGKQAAGFPVPGAVVAGLGGGRRPQARVTVSGPPGRTGIRLGDGRAL